MGKSNAPATSRAALCPKAFTDALPRACHSIATEHGVQRFTVRKPLSCRDTRAILMLKRPESPPPARQRGGRPLDGLVPAFSSTRSDDAITLIRPMFQAPDEFHQTIRSSRGGQPITENAGPN